jgi:hypothetical protein
MRWRTAGDLKKITTLTRRVFQCGGMCQISVLECGDTHIIGHNEVVDVVVG